MEYADDEIAVLKWNAYEEQQGQQFAYEDNTVMVMTDRGAWESNAKALFNKISNRRYQLILENENH
jgi:hypothetical protein